jgi:hypothetical protein
VSKEKLAMKNAKHRLIFYWIALVLVMVFTSCNNPFNPSKTHTLVEGGYGRISISLAGGEATARTVLPPTVFDRYVYTFREPLKIDNL